MAKQKDSDLLEKNRDKLVNTLTRALGGDEFQAEDAVHDAFLKRLEDEAVGTAKPIHGTGYAYMLKVSRRQMIDNIRSEERRHARERGVFTDPESGDQMRRWRDQLIGRTTAMNAKRMAAEAWADVAAATVLTAQVKEAFNLMCKGHRPAEIAAKMGISTYRVRQLLKAAVAFLN